MTFAHLAEAHNKLIASLDEVRKRREAGADDWRYSLLRTFRQYCVAIGIERALIDPVQAMLLEIAETVVSGRRRPGPGAPPLPLNEAACLTMAAASVTVLKERGDFDSISAAVQAASKASGLDAKRLNTFRNEISRGKVSDNVSGYYRDHLGQVRTWETKEIIAALGAMRSFVT
jgi:hypothetical protein